MHACNQFRSLINLTPCISLDCGWKLEHVQVIHVSMGEHANSTKKGLKARAPYPKTMLESVFQFHSEVTALKNKHRQRADGNQSLSGA